MEAISNWFDTARALVQQHFESVLEYLPSFFGALALVLTGWLVASFARFVLNRFGEGINGVLGRVLTQNSLARMRLSTRALQVTSTIAYWIVMLFFFAQAASVGRLEAFATWLDRIVGFVPTMIGGALIILGGYIISTVVRDVVSASLAATHVADVKIPALLAQGATFLIAIVIGIDQVGIDVSFLVIIFSILLGGILLAFAIAFALGARTLVSNLIGAREFREHYAAGQAVQIGELRGTILELTTTGIVLDTVDGRVIVPAAVFHEQNTTLLVPEA